MKILSVDTSCDESCVAIVDTATWKLLADVVHSHVDPMKKWGGVVPEIASREHLKALPLAIDEACSRAGLSLKEIDYFTVTNRPGLIGALLVGVSYIKALAFALKKPFSVMNHIEAHLFSPLLSSFESGKTPPPFPWVALVVSGGHTELFHVKDVADYRWLGGTVDDAAGEAFDKVGKLLGLPYPQGPRIDKITRDLSDETMRSRYAFPRAKTGAYEFSYSGLKTAVALQIEKLGEMNEEDRVAVAASGQEAILDPLIQKARSAAAELGVKNIVVTGGVACNSRLRAKFAEAYFPEPRHCTDNAAMVACLSALLSRKALLTPSPFSETAYPSASDMFS